MRPILSENHPRRSQKCNAYRPDPRRVVNTLDVLDREVGHADGLDLARLLECEHRFPGVRERRLRVELDPLLVVRALGHEPLAGSERGGPVDQVEVEIVDAKLCEGLVELLLDELGLVGRVPQLGGDEELLTLDDGGDDLLERAADLVLVLIDHREIEMAVAVADGDLNLRTASVSADPGRDRWKTAYGILDLVGLGQPGPETDLRDLRASVEGEELAVGHCAECM